MSQNLLADSLERLHTKLLDVYNLSNLDEWITRHSYLNGELYTYKDHEYQIPILRDSAKTSIIVKCAQVGLSELAYRWAVAACCIVEDMTVIYTFPTATDAENNNRTRINPMIEGSPFIKSLVNPDMNNASIKQFGKNSFLFFKGTKSDNVGLSTPANAVVNDEYDKSDQENVTIYVSRLQHKPHKIRKLFSTPTVDGYGISKEAETSIRHKHLARCLHCNHIFLPDYYENVVVPGWNASLEEITRENLHKTQWRDAHLACPKCGRDPNLHHSRMEFVAENPSEAHAANSWYVSPFSAHNIISIPYLVQTSTQYKKVSEFKNQALGLTAEDKNDSITASDLSRTLPNLDSSELHCMGADMGLICHIYIGRPIANGEYLLVHREKVHYTQFEERTRELAVQYRVYTSVMDSQPYTDLVTRVTRARPNWWGAIFTTSKTPQAFNLQEDFEDISEGKMAMRLVKINRNVALDELLGVIKDGKLIIKQQDDHENFVKQMTSLKRVQMFTKDGELSYVWQKSDGEDHYHFACLYLKIACDIRGTAGGMGYISAGLPVVHRVKNSKV